MLFVMPVAFIVVFGMSSSRPRQGPAARVGVWHAPGDARGERVVAALTATGRSRRASCPREAVRAAVVHDDVVAGLIVPPDFVAGTHPVELSSTRAWRSRSAGRSRARYRAAVRAVLGLPPPGPHDPVIVVARTPPGIDALANISAFQVTVPGNAVLFGFFIALIGRDGFTEERRSGTWRRSLAAPVPPRRCCSPSSSRTAWSASVR